MKKTISVFLVFILISAFLPVNVSADDSCMLDHDYVLMDGRDATCTQAGYSEHYECSRCGDVPDTVVIGGVTLTQILQDLSGAFKTRAAVVEGFVDFTDPSNGSQGQGEPGDGGSGVSPADPGSGEPGIAPADPGSGEPGIAPADPGTGNPGIAPVDPDPGSNDEPEFSREFLTVAVVAIAGSREGDLEDGFTAESVTVDELSAAINILNDVLDLKIELPHSTEEYIKTNGEVFYNTTATEIQNTVTYFLPLGHLLEGERTVIAQPSADSDGSCRQYCSRCCEFVSLPIVYMPGDADGDAVVNLKDLAAVKKSVAGSPAGFFVIGNADLDTDGLVNVKDLAAMKKLIAG